MNIETMRRRFDNIQPVPCDLTFDLSPRKKGIPVIRPTEYVSTKIEKFLRLSALDGVRTGPRADRRTDRWRHSVTRPYSNPL